MRYSPVTVFRMVMARKKYMEIRYLAAVIKIQAAWRGYNARREQIRHKRRIALIQGLWRRKMAVRELKQLKVEAKSVGKLKETNYKLENKVVELSQSIQKKTKENNALTEKVSHLENALHSTKEKLSKLEANMKNASAGASAETAELKKQLSSTQETLTSMQKQNDRMTSTMKQKDDEIVALQEKLQAASDVNRTLKETQKTVVNGAPAEDPEAVAAMKKEISSLREQVSKLLAGKYKADLITETRRSETSLFSSVAERVQQVFPLTQTPSQFLSREPADPNVSRLTLSRTQRIMPDDDLESPVSGEIPEMDVSNLLMPSEICSDLLIFTAFRSNAESS